MQYCPNCRKIINTKQSFSKDLINNKFVQEIICSECQNTLSIIKTSLNKDKKIA